jgi:CDP-diacylglycerol---glycerol-3-phosphate 3-phosphatidyltransferase
MVGIIKLLSVYQLKSRFQDLLNPIMLKLYRANVSANQVTLGVFISSLVMAGMLYFIPSLMIWFALPVFMLIRMAGNAIDGMLARQYNQQTDLGFMLNEITDLLADAALLLAFSAVTGFDAYWLVSLLLLTWLSEFIALMGQIIMGERQNSGPLGKSDRAVFLSVFAILIGMGIDSLELSFWFFIIGHLLLLVTCFNRVTGSLKTSKRSCF